MSGNGKQVQLAPGQSPRYACVTRPHTPQRADGFPVPSSAVGSYVTGGGGPGHLQGRLPQPPTPPQQDPKQQPMNYGQAGVRPPPNYQYRGGPPQPQQMQRPAHHRQQASWASPGQAQQVVFSMAPVYLPSHLQHGLPPAAYPQQPPPRTQFFQQPAMPSILQQQHYFSSYPNQGQQPYMYNSPAGQQRAQATASQQSLQQPPQQPPHAAQHPMLVSNRYAPMQHVPGPPNEKKRRAFAIAIVDPKSGKDVTDEILEDDANSEAGDRAPPQPDENSLAVVEEFARRVTEVANEKDDKDQVITDKIVIENESHIYQIRENSVVIIQQSLEELTTENKPEPDPVDDKYLKHNQLTELSETPVVSAISNSPEIVPKQSHITKQKLIENMVPEVKKAQLSKPKHVKPQNLIEVVIDDIPEPKEILCKDNPLPPRQISQAKPIISEEIIEKTEDKPVEVQPLPAPVVENNITVPPVNVATTNKSKLAYVNSQQNEQNIKDTLLNPFNRAPVQHIIPTNQETPKVPTGDALPNPPQKHKQETKKNKTRLNNAERAATHPPKVPDADITEVKPTQALNNSTLPAVDKISPPKDVTQSLSKKESSVPPQVKSVVPEAVIQLQPSLVTSNQLNNELKEVVVNLEEIIISSDSKIENEQVIIPTQATVPIVDTKLDEEIELAKEIGEKEPTQVEAPVEIVPVPETIENEVIPDVTNAENSLEPNESAPKAEGEDKASTDKPVTPMLRYSYREDQWSPLNTSGKKCYDADFLLMLRDDPNSKKKPENINQLEIVSDGLRTPRNPSEAGSRSVSMMRQNDLLPGFARSATHNTTPNRKSQHGKPNSKGISTPGSGLNNRPNIIHVNLSLRSDVKLNETTNAWKPARMRATTMEEDEIATQELYKTFRSVLNKLTPQKFDTLIAKVRKLNIDTKERLIGVINLVFEKAIDEPNFSVAYALMCRELEQINVPDDKEDKAVNFRSLIVGRCQSEFEKDDNTTNERKKEIDECTDPEKKKELILALEEEERKIRRRSVGNVRFIGELFKQNIIVSNIIVYCIHRLLKKIEEETLECLCKLFTTIGKDLEKKSGLDLTPYFVNMKGIVEGKNEKVSSRVRFMLQDVIDLRHNHWVPRQQATNANPKTMDQIKHEVEMEQKSAMYSNFSSPANMSNRKDDRPNNMNKRGASKSVTEDGWSQAPSRNARATKQTPYIVDSGKLSKMIVATPITQTSLQPSSTSMWGKGSTVTTKKAEQWTSSHKSGSSTASSGRKPVTETANMYNALDNQYSEASPASQTETASGRKLSYRSKGASIERSTFKSDTEDQEASSTSLESTSNKIKEIMTNIDSSYGILDKIQTNFTKEEMPLIVKELLLWGLEDNKKESMKVVGDVTGRLVDDENITQEEFILVVKQTIDHSCSYLTKEGNLMWKMLSAFILAHMKKNPLSLKDIHVAFTKVIELDKGFELLTAIFLDKLKEHPEHLKNLWEKSNMQLSDWMSPDRVEQFLEEFPLKWLNTTGMLSQEEACSQMLEQMQAGESRDSIKAWIEVRIGEAVQDGWFIRAITEAVHTYALCPLGLDKPRFDPNDTLKRLSSYYPLLSAYVANKGKRELECLFAIQHLIHKLEYPQGITLKVFEYLWEYGEIISFDGFMSWEKNDDPHEQEGKGVMLKTLTSFFTSLKSLDGSSEEGSETASVIEDEY